MFGATAVRQKRERERRDRLARGVKVSSRVETKIPDKIMKNNYYQKYTSTYKACA